METGDMAEVERQLTLESGRILTAAATFCCGGPDGEYEHSSRVEQQSGLDKQLLGNLELVVMNFGWKVICE